MAEFVLSSSQFTDPTLPKQTQNEKQKRNPEKACPLGREINNLFRVRGSTFAGMCGKKNPRGRKR